MKRRLTTLGGLLLGALAAWLALRDLRLAELASVLGAIGPASALAFVPQAVSLAIDTAAWQMLLRRLGDVVPFARLARARVAAEFMALALPAGPIVADGTLSVVLTRWCGVRSPDAVAAVATRKLMIWRAHAACLLLAGLGGWAGLGSALTHRPASVGLLVGGGLVVGLLSFLLGLLAGSAQPAARLRGLLLRVPIKRLRRALAEAEAHFQATDVRLAAATRTRAVRVLVLYVLVWMTRAAEPWVILRLAGAPLPFVDVLAAETVVGVVRSAVMLVPAGLGVQELGYAMFLRAAGAPDPAALTAALAILRRLREAFWALAGYILLMKQPAAPGAPVEGSQPAA